MANHPPQMTGTKVCTKCERKLPVIFFSANKNCKDGLSPHCRECQRKVNLANRAKNGKGKNYYYMNRSIGGE